MTINRYDWSDRNIQKPDFIPVIKRELPLSFYDKSRYAYASTYATGWDETKKVSHNDNCNVTIYKLRTLFRAF